MATKVRVAKAADVPIGEARVIDTAGRPIALVNAEGTFYAVDNTCLHRGGPVGEGATTETYAVVRRREERPSQRRRWAFVSGLLGA